MKKLRTFLSKIPVIGRAFAYYEAAIWKWGERSWIPGAIQDARLDATAMSRKEILRKARYFDRNNAFVAALADTYTQYTVGSNGLPVISDSPDANAYFNNWCKTCDALGILNFAGIQTVAARSEFIDGDDFIVRVLIRGKLKIQIIEGHRVETPPSMMHLEGVNVIDGCGVDANGTFTGIWVNIAPEGPIIGMPESTKWKFVPAEDVIPVMEAGRSAQYRGISHLAPVMNDINDLDDLQMFTMQVAKQAAAIGNVTTNRSGELSTQNMRRSLLKINSTTTAGSSTTKTTNDWYNVKLGATEMALQHGDSIKQFQADRPSLAEREFWDYLTTKICAGVKISKLLVMPYSMQGTVVRLDADVCAASFRRHSARMQEVVRQIFFWVIEWAQDYDREVKRGGFDFTGFENVVVRAPRSFNVDIGRNSKALISEKDAGIRTLQDIAAEAGQDWRDIIDQKGREADEIKKIAAKYNVDPNDIAEMVSSGLQQKGGLNATENENDELPSPASK